MRKTRATPQCPKPLARRGWWFFSILMFLALALPPPCAAGRAFTFVVLGDNRGEAGGALSPAFKKVLAAVAATHPRFVWNTGDMIYGHTNLAATRQQWGLYREAVATLGVPVYHIPGNHDLWDAPSAALYREICGPTYFAFDYDGARFIGLDSESNESRLGHEQFEWLRRQLAEAGDRPVFVMLHRPLFPAHEAIGSSMDAFPEARDELHRLFAQHHRSIRAVFLGHEHVYHCEERDGVRYYTTGGAGANLREASELGGFHHFLLVRVSGGKAKIELKRVGAPGARLGRPRKIQPGDLLESWEEGLLWYPWDNTVTLGMTARRASEGTQGLQFNFDAAQCPWPVLLLPLRPAWDLGKVDTLSLDVYLPGGHASTFVLTPVLEGTREFAAPAVPLKPGWNTVHAELNGSWLPDPERRRLRALSWSLESKPAAGRTNPSASQQSRQGDTALVFDNFRAATSGESGTNRLLDGWERSLLWRLVDETVGGEFQEQQASQGRRAIKLSFDFSTCPRPVLLARLNPPWDLRRPTALLLDVYAPADVPAGLSIRLGLRAQEISHLAPPVTLRPGWNQVRVEIARGWLPDEARAAAEQIEWRLNSSNPSVCGWIVLDHLRAEGASR